MPTSPEEVAKALEVSHNFSASVMGGIEDENRILKEALDNANRELEKFKRAPLIVAEVRDVINGKALIRLPNGNEFLVEMTPACEPLRAGDSVLSEQKNLTVIQKIPQIKRFDVERFVIMEKPAVRWEDVGGLSLQMQELREVIELPLANPGLFKRVGIQPPKGVLLYGSPGTGKTLLAKAVANATKATFIEVVGSELVQKFIGEGAKLVKEMFQLAREKAPSIVFIDELDAIAATRMDIGTSGEREVQRTFMQLLAEIDGFHPLDNVKVIASTNRRDILDSAVIRPGRLDRLIHVPLPDEDGRRAIFDIHTRSMRIAKGLEVGELVGAMDGFSGAEIKAVATEAGYAAIRTNRVRVTADDFWQAVTKIKESQGEEDEPPGMFG